MDFGQRIRYLREKRGMTQDELAHKVGYSGKSTIAKVESGAFDVTRSKVAKFASSVVICVVIQSVYLSNCKQSYYLSIKVLTINKYIAIM